MNKNLFFIIAIFILTAQKAFCVVETVSPDLQQSLKTHSNEPGFMSILFALLVVILLIYTTGLIYSKLNIVGAKTVQNQLKNYDLSKVIVLSTTQLGQSQNLHVIELNAKRYLIGATQQSINLIKELGEFKPAEEQISEAKLKKAPADPMQILYGEPQEASLEDLKAAEEFDVHKKYL